MLVKLYKIRDKALPEGSKRKFLARLLKKAIKNPKVYFNKLNKDNIKKLKYYMKNEDLERINERLNNFDEKYIKITDQTIKITEVEEGTYEKIIFNKSEKPLVSIIIPVYNQWHYTYSCLKSIKDNTNGIDYEIIIADDVSNDLTKDVESYIENITVIRNEVNLGFLLNCNNAAKHAKGKYIHFLNNDTNVQQDWLSSLVELIEKDEKIGMVGSKLVYSNGKLQESGGIIWNDASGWNYGRLDDPFKSEYNYVKEVDYISGASIMIKKSLWREIGGFDERYVPAYFEDSDLAFEVRKSGYKVMYQPKSIVVHFEGISHGTDENAGIKSYQVKNKEKFIEKWKDVLNKEHFNNAENVFLARDKSGKKETVVVIDHYVPHYDKDAGSRTTYQYLNLLIDMGFNVKFIGDNFFKHEPYTNTLQQNGIEVLYGEQYYKNWTKWIKENSKHIDYIFLHRPHIASKYIDFMKKHTKAKIIYYVHDIHYLRELREYELTHNEETLRLSNEWKEKELDIMSKSDAVLTPSVDEKVIISKEIEPNKAFATPIFYYKKFEELDRDFKSRENLLFVGGFGHKPNEDGMLWFINEIWPLVVKALPEIKLTIVGSNPTKKIKSLECDNINVTGFVSDEELENYYEKSRIGIIPLRYGAGVKGKTIEAMYNNIPIVSTGIGIEGLENINEYIKGYDNALDFANEIINLYNDEQKMMNMCSSYNKYLKKYFSHKGAKELFSSIFTK
ncbi:glycosyltransferase [Romboutsia maritimum]|uniref:Glycosyltransferase n=1 Tax=Romboutsia maritimum TaxID=2020948 RepID=A0A371IS08_9FIRM|nr:glycosyltransferase [Romboutsia maritimum]RDY23270.1 glycosyltransferase [Romboutsia maritimum]